MIFMRFLNSFVLTMPMLTASGMNAYIRIVYARDAEVRVNDRSKACHHEFHGAVSAPSLEIGPTR
jgi:hypothetical protein